MNRRLLRLTALLYGLVMLWLLFGRQKYDMLPYWEQVAQDINLTPFATIRQFAGTLLRSQSAYLRRHAVINLAGNVAVFVPAGAFLPALWEKLRRTGPFLLASAGGNTLIELGQLFSLRGSLDVDDLLLNLCGMLLGFGLYRLWMRRNN